MPAAEIAPGSTWERLLHPGEHWILRDNETGEAVAVAFSMGRSSLAWSWQLTLSRPVIGCTLGYRRQTVLAEVERALEKRGCLTRPVTYGPEE